MINAKQLRAKYKKEMEEYKINGRTKQDIYDIINRDIENAAKKGRNHCCFYPYHTIYDCWVQEMIQYYSDLGYTFRPTGVIGGVAQDTLEICW